MHCIQSQCTPVPDRQAYEHHGNSATIRSTNALRAKKYKKLHESDACDKVLLS